MENKATKFISNRENKHNWSVLDYTLYLSDL